MQLPTALRQCVSADWSQLTLREAARLVPAVVLSLAAVLWLGDPRQSALVTSGAFIVGFGAFQQFTGGPAAVMAYAAAGVGVSTFIGTLAGQSTVALAVAAALYGFGCGLLPAIGMGAFWIAQQCTVFLVISAAYSGGLGEAAARCVLVLGGAATQIAFHALIRFAGQGRLSRPAWSATRYEARRALSALGHQVRMRGAMFGFALRFASVLVAATLTERALAIPNGYWVAMTALLLMRPDFQDTLQRSLGRIGGTLLGAIIATVLSAVLAPGPVALAVLVALFAFLAYGTLRLNYGVFSFFLTAYVVFLLALAGLGERQVAGERVISTLIGAAFALAAHIDFYFYRARRRAQAT